MTTNENMIPKAMVTSERTIRFDFSEFKDIESNRAIKLFCRFIEKIPYPPVGDIVPSKETVTVFYEKELENPNEFIKETLSKWKNSTGSELIVEKRTIEIPVCYDVRFSDDLWRIMEFTGLSREEIIDLHTSPNYTVHMIGFLPGFPYLGGLPESLHVPRLEKPRLRVAEGTVGIGGTQTGIYPLESPGGWNILGRTPIDIYNLNRAEPFLIRAGDQLSFYSIAYKEFCEIKEQVKRTPDAIRQFVKEE